MPSCDVWLGPNLPAGEVRNPRARAPVVRVSLDQRIWHQGSAHAPIRGRRGVWACPGPPRRKGGH